VSPEPQLQLLGLFPLTLTPVSKSEEIFVREEATAQLGLPWHTAVLQAPSTTSLDRGAASIVPRDIFVQEERATILILSLIALLGIFVQMALSTPPSTLVLPALSTT
jgi:hypothetical protein